METIRDGLGFYAMINTYGMIFIGVVLLISAIAFLYFIITSNYKKSPNSKLSYSPDCNADEIKNNKCKIEVTYTDGTTIYKNPVSDPKATVGDVTVFYKEREPKSYTITESPYIPPGLFSFLACVMLTIGIVRLMILRSSKEGAAILGGLDMLGSVNTASRALNPSFHL